MASLKNHGDSIIMEFMTHKSAYCSDGHVLMNRGGGWKLYKKLKAGVDYRQAVANVKTRQEEDRKAKPCKFAFLDAVREHFPKLRRRLQFIMVFEALAPSDPDGIWSELQDNTFPYDADPSDVLSLNEIVHLCGLYRNAREEL